MGAVEQKIRGGYQSVWSQSHENWTFYGSLFFCCTVFTTVGEETLKFLLSVFFVSLHPCFAILLSVSLFCFMAFHCFACKLTYNTCLLNSLSYFITLFLCQFLYSITVRVLFQHRPLLWVTASIMTKLLRRKPEVKHCCKIKNSAEFFTLLKKILHKIPLRFACTVLITLLSYCKKQHALNFLKRK